MDPKNSYKSSKQYLAYCNNTNEKSKLHKSISNAFVVNPAKILDLGCGNGVNSAFLADRFPTSLVDAVERSEAQITEAVIRHNRPNIHYFNVSFEQFGSERKYDFILASHVLQYIDSDLGSFVKKATEMLEKEGELWFVQQTREGMAQIISHQLPYLNSQRFRNRKTFEDYKEIIEELVNKDYEINDYYLDCSFSQPDFENPSEEDKLRFEFIFCLDESFDKQSPEFKHNLSRLKLGDGQRISHPNGILRVKRIK